MGLVWKPREGGAFLSQRAARAKALGWGKSWQPSRTQEELVREQGERRAVQVRRGAGQGMLPGAAYGRVK